MKIDECVKNQLQKDAEITVHNFFAMAGLMGVENKIEFAKKCLPLFTKLAKAELQKEIERERKFNDLKDGCKT